MKTIFNQEKIMSKKRSNLFAAVSLALFCAMALNFAACSVSAGVGEDFAESQMELSLALFKNAIKESEDENTLISPLSLQIALAMVANGADGETKKEIEELIGSGTETERLNKFLKSYIDTLTSDKNSPLEIANSIWSRDDEDFDVNKDFIKMNKESFDADFSLSPFDNTTVDEINKWVEKNTHGMIDGIIDNISANDVMILINALAFDAEWAIEFSEKSVKKGFFAGADGKQQLADMMTSSEKRYVEIEGAEGFIKGYAGGKYSFAALLPNEKVGLNEFVESLDAKKLLDSLKGAAETEVMITLPKFTAEYELEFSPILENMGMKSAFDSDAADLSKLGVHKNGNLYISSVKHKTFISLDRKGTEAGAASSVTVTYKSSIMPTAKELRFDRPFLYMIIDNETSIPIFIGALNNIAE